MDPRLETVLENKILSARQSLREMGEALRPGDRDPQHAILEAAEALVVPWQQRKFWTALETFIVTIRSIPDIVQSWCGDHRLTRKPWFLQLSPQEKQRRSVFQSKFKPYYESFSKLPLSRGRQATIHSKGIPPIDVIVRGRWGRLYMGTPTDPLPESESQPLKAGNDPSLQWAATQPPVAIRPMLDDFRRRTASGRRAKTTLRIDCNRYLKEAQRLVRNSEQIYSRIYGASTVTAPPDVYE